MIDFLTTMKMGIAKVVVVSSLFIASLFGYAPETNLLSGTLPIAGSTYNLSGSGITSSATSIILTSFTLKQTGYEILDSDMSSTFYLTIEPGSNTKQEIVSCTTVTQSGSDSTATLSGCVRGLLPISPYTASSTYAFTHSGGSQVVFSNPPQFYNQFLAADNNGTITGTYIFNGAVTFSSSSLAKYDGHPCTGASASTTICDKDYSDNLIAQGAATSSNTVAGITKLSVAAASANNPIAVGDNDTRVPTVNTSSITAGRVAALVGFTGTPSATNVYLTKLSATSTASSSAIVQYTTTGQITATTTPVATTDATSKAYVDGQTYLSFKMGTTTRALDGANAVVTIPHGLGRTPHKLTIRTLLGTSIVNAEATAPFTSTGFYNGTNMVTFFTTVYGSNGQAVSSGMSSNYIAYIDYVGTGGGDTSQTATSTVDATNIYLGWVKNAGSQSGTINVMWEVE